MWVVSSKLWMLCSSELAMRCESSHFECHSCVLIAYCPYSIAYRSGVTAGTVSLRQDTMSSGSIISGLSTTFRTGAAHGMDRGAIVQNVAALHVTLARPPPLSGHARKSSVSVSEQFGTLRRLLWGFEPKETQTGLWFSKAMEGRKRIC